MRSRTARELATRGFTLIEVLLALMIGAMLFTGAFWSINQVVVTRNAVSNLSTPYIIGPAILDVMAEDLANLYFYDLKDNNGFYGSDTEIHGREADAISFIALSKAYAPAEFGPNDLRYSFANEIAYVMRRGAQGTPFLELWRREDYFVDDRIHSDGDYVLLYDKVHSLSIQYVSRNPMTTGGLSGATEKEPEQMLQDGWNSIEENGVPRALQVTLNIYARDNEEEIDIAASNDRAKVYTFKRFIGLPQIHMSLESEQSITSWDGKFQEARAPAARGGQQAGSRGGAGGRGGGDGGPPQQPGSQPGNPFHPRGRGQRGAQQGPNLPPGANPFLQALQNRGRGQGGAGGLPPGGLQQMFGAGR